MKEKRKIRIRAVLSLVIAVLVTVIIAAVVFLKSGLLSYQLSRYVNEHYLDDTPFRFACGQISGNLIDQVSLSKTVLRYEDGENRYDVFRAESIKLDYDLIQTLKLKLIARNLELDGVQIVLREDDEGELVLPSFGKESDESESGVSPVVDVQHFSIRNLSLDYAGNDDVLQPLKDVSLTGALQLVNGEGDVTIDSGSARLVDSGVPLEDLQLRGSFGDDGIRVQNARIQLEKTFVVVSGRYHDGRFHHLQAAFNPLDLGEVSGFLPIDEKGELGGSAIANGPPDSLALTGSITGRAFGLVFSGVSLEGLLTDKELYFSKLDGAVYGSRVNGDFRLNRDTMGFSFKGVCEALDITEGFIKDEGVPETHLNGFVSLDHDPQRKTYDVRADLRRSSVLGFEGETIQGRLLWTDGVGLRIRSMKLERPGFVLNASGLIDPEGDADLILDLKGNDTDYLMEYVGLPMIGGSADLSGRLVGPLDSFQLNLNGAWYELAYLNAVVDSSLVQAQAKNVGSPDMSATLDVRGQRLELVGKPFADPHVLLEAKLDSVIVRDFSFSRGDTFITTNLEVAPDPDSTHILVKHLSVRMPHSTWRNRESSTIVVTPDEALIDSLTLFANGHSIGLVGTWGLQGDWYELSSWGENLDLALLREAMGIKVPLSGTGRYNATLVGDLDEPDITVEMELTHGVVDSLVFDRVDLTGRFGVEGYTLEHFLVQSGSDSLQVEGNWRYNDSPFQLARDGLTDEGRAAPVSLRVNATRYPLANVFKALHQRQFWLGAYDGTMTVENTLANPRIRLLGMIRSRRGERYQMPPTSVDVVYADSLLTLNQISLSDQLTRGQLRGQIPIRLGLGTGVVQRYDAPLLIDGQLTSSDLTSVSEYFEQIAVGGGELTCEFHIGGTLGTPDYAGTVDLKDGTLRLSGQEELYREVEANVSLNNDRITLHSIQGAEGKKGTFKGSGDAVLKGFGLEKYDATFELENFLVETFPDVVSTQSGQLRIHSDVNTAGETVPMISGDLFVKNAVITMLLGQEETQGGVTGPTESPAWLCNINLTAPNNVWLKNPDLNIEMSGDLIMIRDERGFYFRGDLTVLRGSYALYNNKFRITDGRIDFSTGTTQPETQISAFTPHRVPGEVEHRIFLDLNWPRDKKEPTIALSYDEPGYSESDLYKMLGGQIVGGDAGLTTGGAAQNLGANYLERVLNAEMEDMTIDVESRTLTGPNTPAGQRDLSIAVGRYLSQDLYFNYRQGLTFTNEREVNIEYRISRMVLLRSEIIRHSGRGIAGKSRQVTDEINFDIKLRFEY